MKHEQIKKLIIAVALFINISAFAQFTAITPTGGCASGDLYSVYMKDANISYLAGYNCIVKTSNGGNTLTNVGSGVNTPSDYSWGNSDTAYFANGDNIVYTYNAGNQWSYFQHQQSGLASDVHAFSGSYFIMVCSDGNIYETMDGGTTFNALTSGTTSNLNSLHFVSSSLGFACGDDGVIVKTSDGGQNWSKLTSGTTEVLKYIWFADKNNGFACGDVGTIIKTTDGGANWSNIGSGVNTQLNCIKNAGNSTSTYYACGDGGTILKSTDGGSNWTKLTLTNVSDILEKLYFVDSTIGFCVGLNYTILKMDPCPTAKYKIDQSTICTGSQTTMTNLSSGSSNTYSWRINGMEFSTATNAQYTFNTTGTYALTLYAKSAVKACDDSSSQTVTVLDAPAKPTISGLTTLCQSGGTITLLSSATNNQWTDGSGADINGETNPSFVVSTAGTYRVKAVNANTCYTISDAITITSVPGKPVPNFSATATANNISISNTTSNGDWYGWYISDVGTTANYKLISSIANPTAYMVTQGAGTYSLKLVCSNGCGSDSMVKSVSTTSGINGAELQASIDVYPNPANNVLNIKTQLGEKTVLTLCDITGKIVSTKTINPNTQETMNIESLDKGVYMLYFQSGDRRMVQKLVKE
ncbi:MAG: YCF48-related protein [Bacteroidota bacterium]|nr:YCF48-related protein [Bacteroidota bacterium]